MNEANIKGIWVRCPDCGVILDGYHSTSCRFIGKVDIAEVKSAMKDVSVSPGCCTSCLRAFGEQHKPSCHRQGVVTTASDYGEVALQRGIEKYNRKRRDLPEWFRPLENGVQALMSTVDVRDNVHPGHIKDTPYRVAKFYQDFIWGYRVAPSEALATTSGDVGFEESTYNQMIVVADIDFVSLCSHHMLPFVGKASMGYLPDKRVVGLSKLARLVDMFAHRFQLQEQLTQQVVEAFQEEVKPRGCGLVMEAEHMCMTVRGVQRPGAVTVTNALTGIFLEDASVKTEFFTTIQHRRRK